MCVMLTVKEYLLKEQIIQWYSPQSFNMKLRIKVDLIWIHNFNVVCWTPHISYKQILLVTYTSGHVLLNCPTDFLIDMLLSKYLSFMITELRSSLNDNRTTRSSLNDNRTTGLLSYSSLDVHRRT